MNSSKLPVFRHTRKPEHGFHREIIRQGVAKHGWHWARDTEGYWWGARACEGLLQVRDQPPDYPATQWARTLGGVDAVEILEAY